MKSIFFNFQNASPRKCSCHFPRNSTQLHYSWILPPSGVSAVILNPILLAMTCKPGRNLQKINLKFRFFNQVRRSWQVVYDWVWQLILHQVVVSWSSVTEWSFSENGQSTYAETHFENWKKSIFWTFGNFDFSTIFTGHGKWYRNEYDCWYCTNL